LLAFINHNRKKGKYSLAPMIHNILSQSLQALRRRSTSILHEGAYCSIFPAGMRLSDTGYLVTVVDPAVVVELVDIASQLAGDFSGALRALAATAAVDTESSCVESVWCGWLWVSHDGCCGQEGESSSESVLHVCGYG
jgi:hypothetical protein